MTPFTEGRLGVNDKASPPGRHQEQAPKQRCTFRPTTFSSVQCVRTDADKERWCHPQLRPRVSADGCVEFVPLISNLPFRTRRVNKTTRNHAIRRRGNLLT